MISVIIKVEVHVSVWLRLITLSEIRISQKPNLIIVLLYMYIVLKKITTNALSQRSQFIFKHIALGNHALRAEPTDYSLICRYRLVNNL